MNRKKNPCWTKNHFWIKNLLWICVDLSESYWNWFEKIHNPDVEDVCGLSCLCCLLPMRRRWKKWHLPTQTTCGVYLLQAQSVWHWADSPLPVLCPLTSPLWNLTPGTIIIPQLLAPNLWPGLNVRRCVVSWRALVSPQMSRERIQWGLSTTLNGPWLPVQGRHNSHHYVSPKNQNGLGSRFPQGRYQLCWNSRVFIMSETGSKVEASSWRYS